MSTATLATESTTTRHSTTLVDATLASESTTSTTKTSTTQKTTTSTSITSQQSTTTDIIATSTTSTDSQPTTTQTPAAATSQVQSAAATSNPPPQPVESNATSDDPDVQTSAQPNEQNTLPAASTMLAATSTQSQDSAASDTVNPMAIPISGVSSVISPLAVSEATTTLGPKSSISAGSSPSATAPPVVSNSTSSSKMAMAGAVMGVVGGLVFIGLLFFFFRKYRKNGQLKFRRRSDSSALLGDSRGDGGPRSSSALIGKFNRFIAMLDVMKVIKMRTPSVYEGPSPNPAFSNAGSRTPSPPMSQPRRRSMSEPAPTFRERLQAAAAAIPTISLPRKPVAKGFVVERRSPSTTEFIPQLPPIFQRENGSVSSIARAVYSPEADDDLNPFRDPDPAAPLRIVNSTPSRLGTPSITPMTNDRVVFNPMYKVPPVTATPQSYQSPRSQTTNPFIDTSENIGTALPLGSNRPRINSDISSMSRSASVKSRQFNAPVDQIRLSPPSQNPFDPRKQSVSSVYSIPNDSSVEPVPPLRVPPSRYLQPRPPPASQTPRVPAYQPSPRPAYQQSPSMRPPPSAMSSSKFAFNFGEPGPTRPNTFLNDMGTPGGAVTPGANTRMSDPFDLDNPEVLGFMRYDSNENWRNYGRDNNRRSASANNWPMGPRIG